jgi:hypothetical protein
MQRENYWDYMGRRMREEKMITRPGLSSIERDLYQRIEELERKVAALGSHPQQLEMDV